MGLKGLQIIINNHLLDTIKQILQHETRKHNIPEVKIVWAHALTIRRGLLSYSIPAAKPVVECVACDL